MTQLQNIPIIVIGGPTGVGKTAMSLEIAHHFDGEIINGDSMQVYRHLDIGTGKIRLDEQKGIPHHLLSMIEVEDEYDASRFKQEATKKIKEVWARGKLPIIVGGTGLYLEGLLYNLEFGGDKSVSAELRERLQSKAATIGSQALWNELNVLDPVAAKVIPVQNTRRIIRALEVIELTGKLFSEQMSHRRQESNFNECLIILDLERSLLYDNINTRVISMVEAGLETEARWLYDHSAGKRLTSMKGIGYKEWWPYFESSDNNEPIDFDAVIEVIQQNSRRYAKRQLTWFRNRMKSPVWLDNREPRSAVQKAIAVIEEHLKYERKGELIDDRSRE